MEYIEANDEISDSRSNDSWKDNIYSDLEDVINEDRVSISSNDEGEINLSNYEKNKDGLVVLESKFEKRSGSYKSSHEVQERTINLKKDTFYQCGCI